MKHLADTLTLERWDGGFRPARAVSAGGAMSTISAKFILQLGGKNFTAAPPMQKSLIGGMPTLVAG